MNSVQCLRTALSQQGGTVEGGCSLEGQYNYRVNPKYAFSFTHATTEVSGSLVIANELCIEHKCGKVHVEMIVNIIKA